MNRTVFAICICFIARFGIAEWILVDDFESYIPDGSYIDGGDPVLVYPSCSNGGLGRMDIYTGIEGAGGDNAAHFWDGYGFFCIGDVWHQIPLPGDIPVNGEGTLYFRLWMWNEQTAWYVMLSRIAAGEEPDNTAIWGHQAAVLRYYADSLESSHFEAYNDSSYEGRSPAPNLQAKTWYEFWINIDNAFEPESETSTGGYEVYMKGPGDREPVLLEWGSESTATELTFRNKDYASIKSIVLTQTCYLSTSIWLIDDIWFHPGPLSYPQIAWPWCYGQNLNQPIDTGPWLGWLEPVGAPEGLPFWAWSTSLNDFIYLSTCPEEGGAWVFLPRD